MTPARLNLLADAYTARERERQRLTDANIYNLASLVRAMIWGKHPPTFAEAFPADQPPKRAMTDQQMYAQVKALNAMFGGEEAL